MAVINKVESRNVIWLNERVHSFLHMLWLIRGVSVKKSFYAISFLLFLKAGVLSS